MRLINWNYFVAAVLLLNLSGCAAKYKEPPYIKAATIKVDHKNAIVPSYTRVDIYDNPYCAEGYFSGRAAKIGTGITRSSESEIIRVGTGEEIYMSFKGWARGYDEGKYKEQLCINLISFVPRENASYSAYQNIGFGDSCKVVLVDEQTGQELESVRRYKTPEECSTFEYL